jgi:signal transduction histidine kinase
MRWLPRSLSSRLVILFVGGLILAQVVSLSILLQDRGEFLARASGMQSVMRVIDIAQLLDSSDTAERERIIRVLRSPQLRIGLHATASRPKTGGVEPSPQETVFVSMLRHKLGRDREIWVNIRARSPEKLRAAPAIEHGARHARPEGRSGSSVGPPVLIAHIRLLDGMWLSVDSTLEPQAVSWPYRALVSAIVLLLAVIGLAWYGVRWVTRPLKTFAQAAEKLGENIDRAPLPEKGPTEVVSAARALNEMQTRLSKYLSDRTRILTAMSHDLKTPITRMRLRAELLEHEVTQAKFKQDLAELEAMVSGTLDYMRGVQDGEPLAAINVNFLLKSLQNDSLELGHAVHIVGQAEVDFVCRPQSLKRCLANLIENAVKYGQVAHVQLIDSETMLQVVIEDEGPGVPASELNTLFEPFYRVEASRSRETGGTGLGLSIARSIAVLHGGTLHAENTEHRGLRLTLDLPRTSG